VRGGGAPDAFACSEISLGLALRILNAQALHIMMSFVLACLSISTVVNTDPGVTSSGGQHHDHFDCGDWGY
jgi:hypothetical protein